MQSIDIFDTAIFRDVYMPRDIFKLVEQKVGNDFYNKRVSAEDEAIKHDKFYTIDDIYKRLPEFDKNIEIDMEFKHIYANPKILDMYNNNPSNYIFISDMYLDRKTLEKMLVQCGYKNPQVFVSCEEKCNKASSTIFEKVQRRVGIITKHYGDNYQADIIGATNIGIKAEYYPALHNRNLSLPVVKNSMLKKYAANILISEEKPLVKLAKYYAPLIYEFTKWVISQRKPGQSIYFFSRDSFFPYVISHEMLNEKDIHYIHVSRRSLAPLYIKSGEEPLVNKMRTILTTEEFNLKKNKKYDDCMQYIKSLGMKDNDIVVDIGYSGSTQRILEKFLNIKLQGLYVQAHAVPDVHKDMNIKQYLSRNVLIYQFLAEFVFASPEDRVEDYVKGKPYFIPEIIKRKHYARVILNTICKPELFNEINKMNLSLFDVEQLLIHIQNYPSYEMMKLFNEPILTNRENIERGINFDRDAIMQGKLMECYSKSYATPLFKKMLELDSELCSLVSLLP